MVVPKEASLMVTDWEPLYAPAGGLKDGVGNMIPLK
jgi:hypothetical protein